ncbi:UNVERIFIED_CONTAM: hypothetical protein H355_012197 [Colinus virginianus]|nr:hypothetical protein H355_012197 [Colinus virginianus]
MRISLVLMLCVAFLFPGSLGHSSCSSWAILMWDTAPEDVGQISDSMSHPPPASSGTHSYNRNTYSICEDLYWLEANIILMQNVIKRLLLSCTKAGKTDGKAR